MKKFLLLIISFIVISSLKAQTYDTTTYYGKMDFIFNNISHTQITTGLLRDYGIDFLNLDDYTGKVLNDSNYVTLTDWRSLYASIYSEQINTPVTMLYLDTINRLISQYALSNLPVTFTCLYYNYNVLDSNAAIHNLMTIQNGQLYDVAGRTQSPYLLHSVFAIAPTQQTIPTGNNQLILRPQLFLSNTGKTISTLQIDPKGTGTYQTVSFNTPITVNYSTPGLYTLNFKITYTDGTINYSHTKLAVDNNDGGGLASVLHRKSDFHITGYGPPYIEAPFIYGNNTPYYPNDFTADKTYLGIAAQGDYTIDLSVNNNTGKIKKPLIIVSGFDPDAVNNNDYLGLTYTGDYLQRINSDGNDSTYTPIPLNGSSGLDNADSYDIVYLHWHNGTDYIERNAYLLEKLIHIVDSIKTSNGSTEKNVIIGTSMGGLVARWALRDMEMNNIPHDTRLFISDESPNWGANVPPAYQALVQYIAPWQIVNIGWPSRFPYISISWRDMFPEAIDGVNIFNSPAAKQMLIQRYVLNGQTLTADNSTHTSFMNELNTMGWPLNCRNIVLSNGACNGNTVFNDNSEMLSISGTKNWSYFGSLWRSFLLTLVGDHPGLSGVIAPGAPVRDLSLLVQFPLSVISNKSSINFDFGAWAVPSTGTSLIFKGDAYLHRQLLWVLNTNSYIFKCHVNSTSDMLPLDNAPGSKYDISQFGINIDTVNIDLHKQIGNWINANLLQKSFCFVPTVSSLALDNPQQNLRASLCSNIPCLLPAHVADYFAPQQNEIHVSYTTDNSNWILQEQDSNFNCISVCPSSLSISGDASFCITSNSYTIPNLPAGATVTWSASPYGYVQINSPNSNSTTLTKLMDGAITLTATINNACGTNQIVITKQIIAGNVLTGTINQGGVLTPMNTVNSVSAGATLVNFQWPGVTGISCYQSSTNPPVSQTGFIYYSYNNSFWFTLSSGQSITVSFSGTGCGGTTVATRSFTVGGHYYVISPNPAYSSINITTASPGNNLKTESSQPSTTVQVSIMDVNGILKKQQQFSSNTANMQINVADLIPGTYFVRIINGNINETQKLIINR
ncbi:MAG TPA: T9SS type A sorting domain-containing protein [Hanamia sp.]|nr:T9SS type A sorting domain-containing protein [Hanamia sp.]